VSIAVLVIAAATVSLAPWSTSPSRANIITERTDHRSAFTLLQIARRFNDDFQRNVDAPVYDRWDAASRAIISRRDYLARHRRCPNDPRVPVTTYEVTRSPTGAWLVHYSIDGQRLTDWWFYVRGRFVFDLALSNPSAVALYRLTPAAYATSTGCAR